MSLLDVAVTEGTQSKLNHGAVVQDLCWQIRVVDGLLQEWCGFITFSLLDKGNIYESMLNI